MNDHHAVLIRVSSVTSYETPTITDSVSSEEIRKDQIGIVDVRDLIAKANRTPAGAATSQLLVVVTSFITEEAQQALLKIIEEPPSTTRFKFVLPLSCTLLPTLLSRFSVEIMTDTVCDDASFEAFLKASLAERMLDIEKATKSKSQTWLVDMQCGLLGYLGKRPRNHSRDDLEALHMVATTLLTRGASNKMLLELLAITL